MGGRRLGPPSSPALQADETKIVWPRTSIRSMRARGAIRCALAIPLIVTGCLLPKPLEKPSQDGSQWIELSSKHFTLTTDLDAGEATLVARAFERSYELLSRAVFGDALAPDFETDIVDFRTKIEKRQFDREYSADDIWANYTYLMKAVLPVAEEAGWAMI